MEFSLNFVDCLGNLKNLLLHCCYPGRIVSGDPARGNKGSISTMTQSSMYPVTYAEYPEYRFTLATDADADDITKFLSYNFFPVEPLGKALAIDPVSEVNRWLPFLVQRRIKENLSFIVRDCDSQDLVAVCLNNSETQQNSVNETNIFNCVCKEREPNMWKITKLLGDLTSDVNIFDDFSVDSYLALGILAVSSRCGGKGIGQRLVELTESLARERGFNLIVSEATSEFSARAFSKSGFSCWNQIVYAEYELEGAKPFAVDTGIHQKARLMIKKLV